jgi:ACS family hexuronate transporter-like MFS transporter
MNRPFTIPKLRWIIAGLLLAVTLINYLDRMTMAVLVDNIQQSLSLTDQDYAQIASLFLAAYAVMYAGSGYIVDRLGTRLGMAFFVCLWSASQILASLSTGKWSFTVCRVGLGLAEPGSFPAATKAVGEWFPVQQRALGVGIFNAGSSLGAAAAAPVTAYLALHHGWRAAFVFTGALGIVWTALWLIVYDSPRRNRWLSNSEAANMNFPAAAETTAARERLDWLGVISSRPGLMLILARFLTDPVIYFVIFWLPHYLQKERGFDLAMIGEYAWVPYLFGGIGYLFGGWIAGRMLHAGWTVSRARKTTMAIGAAFLPAAVFAPFVPSWWMAITAMCLVVMGHSIWISNLMTLPTDLFAPREVGTAAGFSGMGGAFGGALANWFTGSIIAHFSYRPIFICAGLLHPLALLLVWTLLPVKYFSPAPAQTPGGNERT